MEEAEEEPMVGPSSPEAPTQQQVEEYLLQFKVILRAASTRELVAWDETTLSTAVQWAEGIEAAAKLIPEASTASSDSMDLGAARLSLVKAVVKSPFLLEHPNGAEVLQALAEACGEEGQGGFDQVIADVMSARAKEGVVLEALQTLATALRAEGGAEDAVLYGARVRTVEMQAYAAGIVDCVEQRDGSAMAAELQQVVCEHEHGGELVLHLLRELSRRSAMAGQQEADPRAANRRSLAKEVLSWVRDWHGVDGLWHAHAGLLEDVAEAFFPVAEAYMRHLIDDYRAHLRGVVAGDATAASELDGVMLRIRGLMARSARLEAYCRSRLEKEGVDVPGRLTE